MGLMEGSMETTIDYSMLGLYWDIVPLKWINYAVYGDLNIIYPKPYSIYLTGAISFKPKQTLI